jgi:hypothetical protein
MHIPPPTVLIQPDRDCDLCDWFASSQNKRVEGGEMSFLNIKNTEIAQKKWNSSKLEKFPFFIRRRKKR